MVFDVVILNSNRHSKLDLESDILEHLIQELVTGVILNQF
jgi:hypothetical protein